MNWINVFFFVLVISTVKLYAAEEDDNALYDDDVSKTDSGESQASPELNTVEIPEPQSNAGYESESMSELQPASEEEGDSEPESEPGSELQSTSEEEGDPEAESNPASEPQLSTEPDVESEAEPTEAEATEKEQGNSDCGYFGWLWEAISYIPIVNYFFDWSTNDACISVMSK